MISCRNLSFYYGNNKVINEANIDLPREGVYVIVGENGAGKTTFLKLLLGILESDGVVNSYINDCSFNISENSLYDNLTVYENLYYYALLKGVNFNRIGEVIYKCNIQKYANVRIKKLSKGNKQKVLIAKCLLLDTHLYIFDEPYNGLDPKEVNNFNSILNELKQNDKMVIISSHILSGINDVYDYVILVKNGDIHLYDKNNLSSIDSLFRENI